ncbi:MAG: phosphoribosylglycinamide formyltransferase [bacterium]|nr:phosphoribosylglycinamide formyltransferase [bacterium]
MLRLAIMISGRGSNMEAVIKSVDQGLLNVKLAVVISNNPEAKGIDVARKYKIPVYVFEIKDYKSKDEYEKAIVKLLYEYEAGLVALAGYMKIVGPVMLRAFKDRIINIHPSLLPAFKGLKAQKQAVDYGVRYSGCSVHFVNDTLDGGPVILQEAVPVDIDDTEETLSSKILKYEHILFSQAIKLYSENRLKIVNNKVKII